MKPATKTGKTRPGARRVNIALQPTVPAFARYGSHGG